MCVYSIVFLSGSIAFISFSLFTGAIVGLACLFRCIFSPESTISSRLVLVGVGGVSI